MKEIQSLQTQLEVMPVNKLWLAAKENIISNNFTVMANNNEDLFSSCPLGIWNILYITTVCLIKASKPALYYSSVFVNMPTDFRCSTNDISGQNVSAFQFLFWWPEAKPRTSFQ